MNIVELIIGSLLMLLILVLIILFVQALHWFRFKFIDSKKKPNPDDILKAIRERLLLLDFNETYDPQFHNSKFVRNNLSVVWSNNMINEYFIFSVKEQDREIVTLNSPWYIKIDENKWGEFKEQVLEALDDWLKTF